MAIHLVIAANARTWSWPFSPTMRKLPRVPTGRKQRLGETTFYARNFSLPSSYFIYLALKIISLKSNSALFWKANPGFHLLCGLFSILMESTAVFSALAANAKNVARDAYHSRILHPPMQTFDPF